MQRHTHLADTILDLVVEEIPKIPAKTAMRLGARLYEVINRHLVARVAEDVPYATPAEQSAREEAVAFQHAAADAQLLATHRFNTARFDPPKNPTTESLDAAMREQRQRITESLGMPTTFNGVEAASGVRRRRAGNFEPFELKTTPYMRAALQEGLFDDNAVTTAVTTGAATTASESETREAREGAASRRGRRSRGRKPVVRDSKVRLSKSLSHFDRGPDGRRVVTLNQLALLGEKIDLPLPYVLDLLTKWRRVVALPDHEFEIRETYDVITEWALELLPQGYSLDDVARSCGVSPSTVRTWSRRRDAEPDARKVVAS